MVLRKLLINYSLYNSRAVVYIDIDYMYNPDEIINLLEKFSLEVSKNVPYSKNKRKTTDTWFMSMVILQ